MNDICGALYYRGYYHVWYQLNPFSDRVDWGHVHSCWGHARSRDLIHWEHMPISLAPSRADGNRQCASGCATFDGSGRPMLFYAYTPRGPRQQWAGVPLDDDLRRWKKLDVRLAPGRSGISADISRGWADMFVFREAGRTFATFKSSKGMVCEAENAGLTSWKYAGRMEGVGGECPNFFKLQDRWVLLRSTYPMSWQAGRFDPEQIRFTADNAGGILDYAYGLKKPADFSINRGFYGSSVLFDERQRCLLFAWVGAFQPRVERLHVAAAGVDPRCRGPAHPDAGDRVAVAPRQAGTNRGRPFAVGNESHRRAARRHVGDRHRDRSGRCPNCWSALCGRPVARRARLWSGTMAARSMRRERRCQTSCARTEDPPIALVLR